ncbi:hypothetical protein H5410_059770 [Solanum commersonii]|uniref:PB1-like domain-containing protein n=1 Tax=Solanum commersonii TaxID=4109 RepID=A0A9J5W3Z2_SOLCO|nr:hypothetical protein H5410_059770 [Solanum commersonii]
MVLVDVVFHYGGKWIREPKLLYERKLVHKWEGYDSDLLSYIDITNEYINILGYVGVQQLLVSIPSGKYYEIEGDEGIRTLFELDVDVENIIKMLETVVVIDDVFTDCTSDGTENDSDTSNDNSDYNSEKLEVLALERRRVIDGSLCDYKDLHKKRLRVVCRDKCNFVCLISGEKHVAGVRVKTLKGEHNKCKDPCGNYKVSATTMAFYFKKKLQANPKYKIKEMRVDMKTAFNINAHFEKCKRVKRMILEDMEGSFCDDYKKIGLIEVVKNILPNAMHRFCVRHIEANWRKKGKRSKMMTKVLWWCAWSTYKEELDDYLKTLDQLSEEAKDHLLHFAIQTWCRVFFDTICKNNKVENNLVESFNSWILEARHKSIIGMLEDKRINVMTKFVKNEDELMT